MAPMSTRRWRGIVAVALFAAAVGMLSDRPHLLLLGVVGVVYATYPQLTRSPGVDLDLERRLSNPHPSDGERVEVTVTMTNTGDRFLPDLRVVDGVPPVLRVVDGSPRAGMALRPGQRTSFTYTVAAKRGTHAFDPATIVSRDLSGAREVTANVEADTAIDCRYGSDGVGLREHLRPVLGQIDSNRGGTGTEFHHTREYRHGDPINRIDWNRSARTGDLITIEFQEERSASVVLLVDARPSAYCGRPDQPHAVVHNVSAARQLLRAVHSRRNLVGLAGVGRSLCWISPGAGTDHIEEVERALSQHETFAPTPPPEDDGVEEAFIDLEGRLGNDDQVIVLTPACDDVIVDWCLRLEASGHQVTVVSPDVTGGDTAGERLASIERHGRMRALLRGDIPVYEWSADEEATSASEVAG